MLGAQGLFQVLQFDLSELKFVILCILLAHLLLAMLQHVDFKEAASIGDSDEVSQIYEVIELHGLFFSRSLRANKVEEAVFAVDRQNVISKLVAEALLEKINACEKAVLEHTFPKFVQAAVLNEKDWLDFGLPVHDLPDAPIHLVFDPVGSLSDVAHGLGVNAAF